MIFSPGVLRSRSYLIHDANDCSSQEPLPHVFDFVDDILGLLDLLQQKTNVAAIVNLLLIRDNNIQYLC